VSAGFGFDALVEELRKLNLPGYELEAKHIERNGIVATKIDVVVSEQPTYHRGYGDIVALIDQSALSSSVKDRATRIFHEIAVAEAKVHHTALEQVHFHEVGAIDSLVDIVGASIGLDYFGVESVYSSPVKLGNGGFVISQHGPLPVPTPATVEILRGYPTILSNVPYELTTPTGAAIIKANSAGMLDVERVNVTSVGYGAGTREIEQLPNLLRVMIGDIRPEYHTDEVACIETNIDDMNPELYPFVVEQLLAAGARDAFLVPAVMKKGRPGIVLTVLADPKDLDAALKVVFRETTSIGVRISPMQRRKLERKVKEVPTSMGIVRVKSVLNGGKEALIPEFEECKRIAREKNLPLKDVYKLLEKELTEIEHGQK
jgi:uncharacterized protein (TIGR00299 family) protein